MPDVPVYNFRRDFDMPKQTAKGGYTKKELAKYKVGWPPPKGWKKELLLPHPFKCSRCEFIGHNRDTLNKHYFSSH